MSFNHTREIDRWHKADRDRFTSRQWLVLRTLGDYANKTGQCWPSVESLMDRTALSRRTVFYALKHLRDQGVIIARWRRQGQRQGSNVYTIKLPADRLFQGVTVRPSEDPSQGATLAPSEKVSGCKTDPSQGAPTLREPSREPSGTRERGDGQPPAPAIPPSGAVSRVPEPTPRPPHTQRGRPTRAGSLAGGGGHSRSPRDDHDHEHEEPAGATRRHDGFDLDSWQPSAPDAAHLRKTFPDISDEEFDEQRNAFGIWARDPGRIIETPHQAFLAFRGFLRRYEPPKHQQRRVATRTVPPKAKKSAPAPKPKAKKPIVAKANKPATVGSSMESWHLQALAKKAGFSANCLANDTVEVMRPTADGRYETFARFSSRVEAEAFLRRKLAEQEQDEPPDEVDVVDPKLTPRSRLAFNKKAERAGYGRVVPGATDSIGIVEHRDGSVAFVGPYLDVASFLNRKLADLKKRQHRERRGPLH